ncbi:unnamed protein product [Lampetra fluviatilis]
MMSPSRRRRRGARTRGAAPRGKPLQVHQALSSGVKCGGESGGRVADRRQRRWRATCGAAAPGSSPSPAPTGGEEVTAAPEGSGLSGRGTEPSGTPTPGGSAPTCGSTLLTRMLRHRNRTRGAAPATAPWRSRRGGGVHARENPHFPEVGVWKAQGAGHGHRQGGFMKTARLAVQDPHKHGFKRQEIYRLKALLGKVKKLTSPP